MSKYSIGVDLGGTKILAGIVDTKTGKVIETVKRKTNKDLGVINMVDRVKESIVKLVEKAGKEFTDIKAIGIGAAGQVCREKGILISAPNLDCINIEFKKILEEEFKVPLVLGNDVEAATIGEQYFGAGRGCNNYVCVFVGTGIGSGIVHDGKVYRGASGTAGEIGHIIVHPDGRICGCGNNGCLEAYASRTAVSRKIAAKIKKGEPSVLKKFYDINPNFLLRSKHIKWALEEGDELTTTCIQEAAENLSIGLASVVNFYNPEKIILGGGLVEAVDFFFEEVQKKVKSKCLPVPSNHLVITKTALGDYSGIVGAAIMANSEP